jgi:DNA ligase D-like protein (predicted 3'-phosphoesterase)
MEHKDALNEYYTKRDFSRTLEPQDGAKKSSDKPIYVIQLHKAKRVHFDLRLEVDGLLISWAVPKGPSTDPRNKRLAVRVEDHPFEYADFEGNIPEGEYGAGTVIVWDKGVYENMSTKGDKKVSMSAALQTGHIKVSLFGKKLRGGYTLIQTKMRGEDKNWLLVKDNDAEADVHRNPVSTDPESVLSGKTIEEMERG